ncbi:MAG: AAA family ATPase [Treponema sp.]|nr:AAA family ATPase [Treponema sp.]
MKIYIHCLTNQDLTKQFAYTDEIRREFFDNAQNDNIITLHGIKSGINEEVYVKTATDCRLNAKFQKVLSNEGGAEIGDLVIFYKKGYRFYNFEIIKKSNNSYSIYKKLFSDPRHLPVYINDVSKSNNSDYEKSLTSTTFINNHDQTIYYGVPGSGKSHRIDEITKNLSEEQKIRVVFHPEYTNADFVGQILPCLTSDGIEYRFKAGPFSRILKKAYQNPDKPHYLIIEEINRGNAAAIFGDLFQLLDRDSEGWSSYEIENLDINSFIRSKDSTYSDAKIESSVNVGGYTWTENTGIRLPPNLSLLATMNTSDQNVFTLDNAFQRRWDMELVPNSCSDSTQMQAKISVKEKTITWESFQSKINEVIAEKGNESGFSSMEDKRLGCWFIKNNEKGIDPEKFANKVLKYLWDDAFKFNRSEIFIDEVKNFEELKNLFIGDKGFEIFKDINFDFEPQNLEENQES